MRIGRRSEREGNKDGVGYCKSGVGGKRVNEGSRSA